MIVIFLCNKHATRRTEYMNLEMSIKKSTYIRKQKNKTIRKVNLEKLYFDTALEQMGQKICLALLLMIPTFIMNFFREYG